MYKIHTVVKFETAHRQLGDKSKCGFLHGHNWKAEIDIVARDIDTIGYVVDFKDVKDSVIKILDHKTILNKEDPLCDILKDAHQKVVRMDDNPTCENIARFIKDIIVGLIPPEVRLFSVIIKLYENDNSFAEVSYP